MANSTNQKRRRKARRDQAFIVLLSPREKRQLTRLADSRGLTMSDTVRLLIRAADRDPQQIAS